MVGYAYKGELSPILCQEFQQSIGFDGDPVCARVINTSRVARVIHVVQLSNRKTGEHFVENPVRVIIFGSPHGLVIIASAMYGDHT